MKNSVQSTYNENRDSPVDSRRLLVLCAAVLGVILCLIVPYRVKEPRKPTQIVYAPVWDPPVRYKDKAADNTAERLETGPFIPILLAEFVVLTVGTLFLRDRLGKGDASKLESYPGYQRGF